jgi:glyoxylase-like metal-dependent hydrolase (beta-lactamase superfamily II)
MLEFKTFVFNPFQVNTYLIFDSNSSQGWLIDPGNISKKENNLLSDFIETKGISISKVINTHGHIDHVFGFNYAKENFTSEIYFPFPDLPLLEHIERQADMVGIPINKIDNPKFDLHAFDQMTLGKDKVEIRKAPGHSPGGTLLIFHSDKKVISGDTIFYESIGRTDLWGGDFETLRDSIQNQIFSLPNDYEILPGHGPTTSVGYEKKNNPFL